MKYILRILAAPFVLIFIMIKFNYHAFRIVYLFILHGGEFINYDKEDKPTIKDIYQELVNQRRHI